MPHAGKVSADREPLRNRHLRAVQRLHPENDRLPADPTMAVVSAGRILVAYGTTLGDQAGAVHFRQSLFRRGLNGKTTRGKKDGRALQSPEPPTPAPSS